MTTRRCVVLLLGIHGSGKSTLGRALADRGFTFHPEIGTEMRAVGDQAVSEAQEGFDRHVMALELSRDQKLFGDGGLPIIETWHLGNIAFAEARGSHDTAHQYRQFLAQRLHDVDVAVVMLRLTDEEFLLRCTERGIQASAALSFYRDVERRQDALVTTFAVGGQAVLVLEPPWRVSEAADAVADRMADLRYSRGGT